MDNADATTSAPSERLHAMDAVRAGALLLGVILHATMSFVPGQQIWLTRDDQSPVLGALFFVSHIFRMALFFLIAGFFGRMACERRGVRGFVRERLKRIGIPLVAFWPLSMGSIVPVFIWGIVTQHGVEGAKAMEPPGGSVVETFPLTHLWFLYVLLGLYAVTLAVRGLVRIVDSASRLRHTVDRLVRFLLSTGLLALVLAAPVGIALHLRSNWLFFLGVPTPDRGFIPNAAASIAFGTAFAFGWILHRQMDLLRILERRFVPYLTVAIVTTSLALWIAGVSATLDPTTQPGAQDKSLRVIMAVAYPLAIWTWSLGLLGLALRFLSAPRPVLRYLADASYWIYIAHLPLVMALQVAVFHLPWPALAKFALVLAVAVPILLLTYDRWVRPTFIGALLNGRRYERRRPEPKVDAVVPSEGR